MTTPPNPNDPDVLDGWKSIADYLGKSVRTAQRWRLEFGMPVHRLGGRERENVYAFRTELDAWRRKASGRRAFGAGEETAADRPPDSGPMAASNGERPHGPRTILAGTAALLILALLAYAGWAAFKQEAPRQAPAPAAAAADRHPARWVVVDDEFRFYNAAGEFLFRFVPGPALSVGNYEGHTNPASIPLPEGQAVAGTSRHATVVIADLDGDGRREVLVVARPAASYLPATLHCLDDTGRERWTFRAEDRLVFGGKDQGQLGNVQFVAVSTDARGVSSVWVAAENQTWFPTMVYRLDHNGGVLGRFGSNGRVGVIRFMPLGERQLVLLGGVNNEQKMAAVAVVDVARFGGAAPAESAAYRCGNCTPGDLDAYLLFPPTDLSRLAGGMPNVSEIAVHPSGEVVVSVRQAAALLPGDSRAFEALTNYRLDAGFRIHDAEYYSQYAAVHDHYASAGRLNHRFDARRESTQLWPVLRWTGSGYDRIRGPER